MRKLTSLVLGVLSSGLFAIPAIAQQIDNTQTLPDAKPGECYAKVITPARFSTRSEEVVVQEASERVESIEATYETVDQQIVIKESAHVLKSTNATFKMESEQIQVSDRVVSWTTTAGNEVLPASPDAIEHISRSGIDIEAVKPGSCYVEYFKDTQYKFEAQRVLVKEASQAIKIMPAVYKTVQERVVVKQASSEVVDVPAVYRTMTESVLVEPAKSVWKAGRGPVERIDNTTGEIMCLIEVPARYETLTKTVLDKAASTKIINIPAVYKTVTVEQLEQPASEQRTDVPAEYTTIDRRVKVSDPVFFWLAKGESADPSAKATGREICLTEQAAKFATISKKILDRTADTQSSPLPASYQTIKVQKLVTPASERRIVIPARTKTVTSQAEISPAMLEWRKVLCETNMTTEIITSLQRALKREGFDPGPIDGVVGQTTMKAIERYQTDEGIDRGGITYEALIRLKVQS